jgi:hypothetical protein
MSINEILRDGKIARDKQKVGYSPSSSIPVNG